MKMKRPLQNPAQKIGEQIELVSISPREKVVSSISFFRTEFKKNSDLFRLSSLNQNFFIIFHLVGTVVFTVGFLSLIIVRWESIPPQISLLYINLEGTWVQISKEYFTFIVLGVLLMNIIIYLLITRVNKNKLGSLVLMAVMSSVSLVLFAMAIIQILRLVLI